MILNEIYNQVVTENLLNTDKMKLAKVLKNNFDNEEYNSINEALKDIKSRLRKCANIKRLEYLGYQTISMKPMVNGTEDHIDFRFILFTKSGNIYTCSCNLDDYTRSHLTQAKFKLNKQPIMLLNIYNEKSCKIPKDIVYDFVDTIIREYKNMINIKITNNKMSVYSAEVGKKYDKNRISAICEKVASRHKELAIKDDVELIYNLE